MSLPEEQALLIYSVRRRRAGAIAAAAARVAYQSGGSRRGPHIYRPFYSWPVFIRGIQPTFFARMYRMPKDVFLKLAEMLVLGQGIREYRSCSLMRLSITLRWLAGGSYLDLAAAHHQSISSVYLHIGTTINAIDKLLTLRFPYDDEQWLQESSRGFTRNERSPIEGCVAALDGIAVKIAEPSLRDVPNPSTYYNRKGFFALNIQALCDSSYRFLYVSALTPGSTHDSTAFSMSALASLLERPSGGLVGSYWIAADEAYVCTRQIVSPWPGRNLTEAKDCFNYWQSSARIHVEQAFGIFVARWGILWRPLRLRLAKSAQVIAVCCKLHNFIIDNSNNLDVPGHSGIDNESRNDQVDLNVHLQDQCDTYLDDHRRRRDLEHSDIRFALTENIRAQGLRRPY